MIEVYTIRSECFNRHTKPPRFCETPCIYICVVAAAKTNATLKNWFAHHYYLNLQISLPYCENYSGFTI